MHEGVARALARLHTPWALAQLPDDELDRHTQLLQCQVLPLLKTELQPTAALRPHLQPIINTVEAFKMFGRC